MDTNACQMEHTRVQDNPPSQVSPVNRVEFRKAFEIPIHSWQAPLFQHIVLQKQSVFHRAKQLKGWAENVHHPTTWFDSQVRHRSKSLSASRNLHPHLLCSGRLCQAVLCKRPLPNGWLSGSGPNDAYPLRRERDMTVRPYPHLYS